MRRIAWRIQALAEGDLSERAGALSAELTGHGPQGVVVSPGILVRVLEPY